MPHNATYDLVSTHTPRLKGVALRWVVAPLENHASRSLIGPLFTRNLGLRELRAAGIDEPPTFFPIYSGPGGTTTPATGPDDVPLLVRHGLPAISVPAGYGRCGLPLGLQLIGRPWDESALFRMAYAAENIVARQRPVVHFDLLPELGELGR